MIKVNLIENKLMNKPSKKEIAFIQNIICNEENIKELELNEFIELVGNQGAIWKSSLMVGGSKNENFKEAYVLSLDFDEGITIDDFLDKSKDLGLEPTFIYKSFRHNTLIFNEDKAKLKRQQTKKVYKLSKRKVNYNVINPRFRAIWNLSSPIDNAQIKNALQLILMEVFPQSDKNCKDLSRLWVGGKGVSYKNTFNKLNIENLINATVNIITEKDNKNATRNIKSFCKKAGLHTINNLPFIVKKSQLENGFSEKNQKSEEIWEKSYKILYRGLPENPQLFNVFYDDFYFYFDNNSYNLEKNTIKNAKIGNIKTEKNEKVKIDFDKLNEKCLLCNQFFNGEKLEHNEIKHLSFNLCNVKGYPTILKDNLIKHSYNNWQNKYNTYVSAINYNYAPSLCINHCKHYGECNSTNILTKYYTKVGTCKRIEDIDCITLEEMQKEMDMLPDKIKKLNDKILLVKTPTASGKSEMLTNIDLNKCLVGVSNHKLGLELYDRILEKNPTSNLLYVRKLDMNDFPKLLREEIEAYYNLGLIKEANKKIFLELDLINGYIEKNKNYEIPSHYQALVNYKSDVEKIPYSTSLLFTHNRISFGIDNDNVDTIIIDEDFLNTFIKYNTYNITDINNVLHLLDKYTLEKMNFDEAIDKMIMIKDLIELAENNKGNYVKNNLVGNKEVQELLIRFIAWCIKKNYLNTININVFGLFNAEAICMSECNNYINTIDDKSIKQLNSFKNVIIMSATLDEEIHIPFLKKYVDKEIAMINISNVKTKGNLYCDTSYSWSRNGLKNKSLKQAKELLKILKDDRFDNIITFKSDELLNLEKTDKTKIAWFGACEGLDCYKGEPLAVIGTPHPNSNLIQAYYFLLTSKNPISKEWKVKRVSKYGFEFDLNTYIEEDDYMLTHIQLYMIYSELIQAVGRARILRYNTSVYVYSALPLPQCKLI